MATKATKATINVSSTVLARAYAAGISAGQARLEIIAVIRAAGFTSYALADAHKAELIKLRNEVKAGLIAAEIMKAKRINDSGSAKLSLDAMRIATAALKTLNPTETKWRRNIADKVWSICAQEAGLTNPNKAHAGNSNAAKPTKAEPTKAEPTKAEPTKAEPTKAEPIKPVIYVASTADFLNQLHGVAAEAMQLMDKFKTLPKMAILIEKLRPHLVALHGFKLPIEPGAAPIPRAKPAKRHASK